MTAASRVLSLAIGLTALVVGCSQGDGGAAEQQTQPVRKTTTTTLQLGETSTNPAPAGPDELRAIEGTLPSGDQWRVSQTRNRRLCLTMSGANYGCDDVGPVVAPDAPPETPRIAGTLHPRSGVSEDNAGELAYGYLPAELVAIHYVFADGSRQTAPAVVDEEGQIWGAAMEPGNNPVAIVYMTENDEIGYPTPLGDPSG